MKPIFIPHVSYQDLLIKQLQQHYSGGFLVLHKDDWPLISKLWMTDLSPITTMLCPFYSDRGPEPRDPASMLRCFLVGLMTHPSEGITEWVKILHRTPLYAILSGFEPGDVPGVGTFYDFFHRLWASDCKNVTPRSKSKRLRKRKPKKGKKGEKAPTTTPGRVKRLVEWILPRVDQKKNLPTDRLFDFFQDHILAISSHLGLLGNMEKLNVAGDGTPIVTSAYIRSKSTCVCRAQGLANCNHPRVYSQPDCDSGWDSAREKYFNGYHMYMFNACDSPHDLPLYPRLHLASCHDSVSFVVSMVEFSQRFTLGTLDKILLDAAHDAEAIYTLIDHQKQQPIIDLNKRGKKNIETGGAVQISPEGVP
ncbi:MAG: transposase, partial [Parcubacteria group bacterium]